MRLLVDECIGPAVAERRVSLSALADAPTGTGSFVRRQAAAMPPGPPGRQVDHAPKLSPPTSWLAAAASPTNPMTPKLAARVHLTDAAVVLVGARPRPGPVCRDLRDPRCRRRAGVVAADHASGVSAHGRSGLSGGARRATT